MVLLFNFFALGGYVVLLPSVFAFDGLCGSLSSVFAFIGLPVCGFFIQGIRQNLILLY